MKLKSLRKQNLPHIDSLQKKLTTIFKYKVKHQEGSRVPQAYSWNTTFVVDKKCLKDLHDVKSELNGKSLEAK